MKYYIKEGIMRTNLVIFTLLVISIMSLFAEEKEMITFEEMKSKIENESSFSLPLELAGKEPNEALQMFNQLINNAYQKDKNPSMMNMIGTQEINFLLELLGNAEKEKKTKILTYARAETFNLAVNNWPGWGDEGINLTLSDVKSGLNFAKFNHKLTLILNEPADKQATALWAIGTLNIALKEWAEAEQNLGKSIEFYKQAKNEESVLMAEGYLACIKKLKDNDDTERMKKIEQLKELGTDDSNFYASQLETLVGNVEKFYKENNI
jgi:hypothetical protein